MTGQDVRIVDLPSMRVASALGFGTGPEELAWEMIRRFAADRGIDLAAEDVSTYGFNNPDPSPGNASYGYELWLPVGEEVEVPPPLTAKRFPGGRYAVTRFTGLSRIGHVWKELVAWFEDSPYTQPPNWLLCLEALRNPLEPDPERYEFDLYLPIAE